MCSRKDAEKHIPEIGKTFLTEVVSVIVVRRPNVIMSEHIRESGKGWYTIGSCLVLGCLKGGRLAPHRLFPLTGNHTPPTLPQGTLQHPETPLVGVSTCFVPMHTGYLCLDGPIIPVDVNLPGGDYAPKVGYMSIGG